MATEKAPSEISRELEAVSKQADESGKISNLLTVIIGGFQKTVDVIDTFLKTRGIDVGKAAKKVVDSKAVKSLAGMKDKVLEKFGLAAKDGGVGADDIKASFMDKLRNYASSGLEPPGGKSGFAKTLFGVGKKAFKQITKDKEKQLSDELGADLDTDYYLAMSPLIKNYKETLTQLQAAYKEEPINQTKIDVLGRHKDKLTEEFLGLFEKLDKFADKGKELYGREEALGPEGTPDKRLLKPSLALAKVKAEWVKFNKLENNVIRLEGGGSRSNKEMTKETKSFLDDFAAQEAKYNSLGDQEYGKTSIGDMGKNALGMFGDLLGKGAKSSGKAVANRPKNFIDKIIEGPGGLFKYGAQKAMGKDPKMSLGASTGLNVAKYGALAMIAPQLLGAYGAYRLGKSAFKKDGFVNGKLRGFGNSLTGGIFEGAEPGKYLKGAYDDALGQAIGYDDKHMENGYVGPLTPEQQEQKDRLHVQENFVGPGNREQVDANTLKEMSFFQRQLEKRRRKKQAKKDKEEADENFMGPRPQTKFGRFRDRTKGMIGGIMGTLGGLGSSFMSDIGDAIMNGDEQDMDNLDQGDTSVASKIDSNSPEWLKEKAEREQRRIDEVKAEKEAVQERLRNKGKNGGGGSKFLQSLFGMFKSLFSTILIPGMLWALRKTIIPFMKLMGRGLMNLGRYLGSKVLGLGKYLGTKLMSIISPITTPIMSALGTVGDKLKGWGTSIANGFNKVKNGFMNSTVGKAVSSVASKVKGSWLGKAGSFLFRHSGTALRWAGKGLMKAAAFVFTGPVGWIVGIGLLAWDLYSLYNWLTSDDGEPPKNPTGMVTKARLLAYGLSETDKKNYNKIFELEENVGQFMERDKATGQVEYKPPNDERMEGIIKILDVSEENPDHNESKMTWYEERFIPVYKEYLRSLWTVDVARKLGEIDKFSDKQLLDFVSMINVDAEAFNVKVLPFPEHPFTEVIKKDYDELIVKLKRELTDKVKSAKVPEDLSAENKNGSTDMAKEAEKNWASRLRDQNTGDNNFARYFQDRKDKPNNEIDWDKVSAESQGTLGEPASFGKGGNYDFSAGNPKNIASANAMSLPEAFREAARLAGVPEELLWTFAKIESGLNPMAKNPSSSASGLFQFINSTWKEMIQRTGGKYGLTMENANRFNPLHSALMGAEYMKSNLYVAEKFVPEGIDVGTALYLSHFFGAGGAGKALEAFKRNPNTPMSQIVSASTMNANKSIMAGKTVSQFFSHFQKKFHSEMKKKPEAYSGYNNHKDQNAKMYENAGEAKYMNSEINFDSFDKNTQGGDISNYGTRYSSDPNNAESMAGISQNAGGTGENYSGPDGSGDMGSDNTDPDSVYGGNSSQDFNGMSGAAVGTHPIKAGEKGVSISSWFGWRNPTKEKGASKFHEGIDFAAPSGVKVVATGPGIVKRATNKGTRGYGNLIEITHEDGTATYYAHLSSMTVQQGQKVKGGDVIGAVGKTSNNLIKNMGNHLHFGVMYKGKFIDPWNFPAVRNGPGGNVLKVQPNSSQWDPTKRGPYGGQIKLGEDYSNTGSALQSSQESDDDIMSPMSSGKDIFGSMKPGSDKTSSQLRGNTSFGDSVFGSGAGGLTGTSDPSANTEKGISEYTESGKPEASSKPTPEGTGGSNGPGSTTVDLNTQGVEDGISLTNAELKEMNKLLGQLLKAQISGNEMSAEDRKRQQELTKRYQASTGKDSVDIPNQSLREKKVEFKNGSPSGIDVGRKRNNQ